MKLVQPLRIWNDNIYYFMVEFFMDYLYSTALPTYCRYLYLDPSLSYWNVSSIFMEFSTYKIYIQYRSAILWYSFFLHQKWFILLKLFIDRIFSLLTWLFEISQANYHFLLRMEHVKLPGSKIRYNASSAWCGIRDARLSKTLYIRLHMLIIRHSYMVTLRLACSN